MGNRFLRKKTLKVKQAMSEEQRAEGNNEGNGHIWCKPGGHYMSIDVCFTRQTRTPGKCQGCGHFKPDGIRQQEASHGSGEVA